jgi:ribonuclease VapC
VIVLDSSAVLAVFRSEPGADLVLDHAKGAAISAVNLVEIVSTVIDRGGTAAAARRNVARLQMTVVSFDEGQAQSAAELRPLTRHLGLSLGDRACLALAQKLGATVLTGDRHWAQLDLGVEIQLIR